jgi:phosphatidylserine/phosphatidylglycerophosphate/cardiolipin synthase-like enzyme
MNLTGSMADWFLSADERGNPATLLDRDKPGGAAWTTGNTVRPLVHGATYFAELVPAVKRMQAGDLLMFADWRGDPDERLLGTAGTEVGRVFSRAAARGVLVRGLFWRSHWDRLAFSAEQNRHLGEEVNAAGGCCLLDMRVRLGGSHHQKFVVLRHRDRMDLDVAFVGGIDLCHSRRDDASHAGDPQAQPMAKVYGGRPPWHDIQLAITGPAVADVETVFRERWEDPQPLSRSPFHRIADWRRGDDQVRAPLPARWKAPAATGPHAVQLLRTYGRRVGGYPFAPHGERSVARGYIKALDRAKKLIYIEDQYLWSSDVGARIARALARNKELHLIAVLPHHPDQDGRLSGPPNVYGREAAFARLRSVAPDRVAFYGIENDQGTPVYVHAKVCIIDDVWAATGSDNLNRRSWTHDSELTAAVWDTKATAAGPAYARDLRLVLAREHLGSHSATVSLDTMFETFASSARALHGWYAGETRGLRPPGRVRALDDQHIPPRSRWWAAPLYRTVYDPDARPLRDRLRSSY